MQKFLFLALMLLMSVATARATPLYFSGTTNGATGSATMELTTVGNQLTVLLQNTSPLTLDDGSAPSAPAITGFGFNVSGIEAQLLSWTLTAYDQYLNKITLGSNTTSGYWNMGTSIANVDLDFLPQVNNGIRGALYNPLAAGSPALAAKPDYFTDALLTMNFSSQLSMDQIGDEFVRMQNVNGGSLKLEPVPEPRTMMLVGFGLISLAIYGKRREGKNLSS
jgi:hypothetical protein